LAYFLCGFFDSFFVFYIFSTGLQKRLDKFGNAVYNRRGKFKKGAVIMSERGERILKSLQSVIDFQNGNTTKCRVRTLEMPDIEPVQEFSKEEIKTIRHKKRQTELTSK